MSVWGFMPDFFIVASAADATENAHTPFLINSGPYRDFFRERYLGELRKAPPDVFIVAVGPHAVMFTDPKRKASGGSRNSLHSCGRIIATFATSKP